MLEAARISALLTPFFADHHPPPQLIAQLQTYLDLLLRWNARINLTAVRDPEQIVTRHFGESLLAGRVLLQCGALDSGGKAATLADLGSGAGLPGIPIKLLSPQTHTTLIEANHKKAAFLREVIRHLNLVDIEVFCRRAETLTAANYRVVALRAVEKFESAMQVAWRLVGPDGTLCLLVGKRQHPEAHLPQESWTHHNEHPIPLSQHRVVFIARKWPK